MNSVNLLEQRSDMKTLKKRYKIEGKKYIIVYLKDKEYPPIVYVDFGHAKYDVQGNLLLYKEGKSKAFANINKDAWIRFEFDGSQGSEIVTKSEDDSSEELPPSDSWRG